MQSTVVVHLALLWLTFAAAAAPILSDPKPLLTTAGDPDHARYQRLPGTGYDGVGILQVERVDGLVSCTGTLLETGFHVLTAAHCLTDAFGSQNALGGEITFPLPNGKEETIQLRRYSVHPDWTGDLRAGGDLAVVGLQWSASPRIPRYHRYLQQDELGHVVELVGFGSTGSGATGVAFDDGHRRGGLNRLDGTFVNTLDRYTAWTAGSNAFLIDFDDGSAAHDALMSFGLSNRGLGLYEVFPAPGDSGGPAFLDGRVVAISSFSTRFVRSDGTTPDIDSDLNRSFGELSGLTRLSRYDAWLTATVVPVPEPSFRVLVSLILIICASAHQRLRVGARSGRRLG